MDFETIAENAYHKKGIDINYKLPEKYAYIRLEELYYNYKLGNINKDKSIMEKAKIKTEYEINQKEYEAVLNLYKKYNENRIKYNMFLINIEKAESKEIMMFNALKIIENEISDDTFINRIMGKFKNIS